ncbi:MAG TPA: tetratricopeptide repeat protein [Vicinamibacterales bacterium]|nr:tetratricopeptide repeat protein [Vicinamibacterales bacterium]
MADDDRAGSGPAGHRPAIGLVQREIVLVIVLAVAAAAIFGMTRSLAEWSDRTADAAADEWHRRGRAVVESGRVNEGIALLRQAVSHDRLNADYTLSLVRALTRPERDDTAWTEARRLLVQLREREPDRPEINLRLARLAATAGDTDETIRYYNHAMYGLVPDDPEYDRRRIRVELATFLLDQGDRARALGELFALAPDVPDDAAEHFELGALFLRAGEARSALAEFQDALRLAPGDWRAAAGAGDAALATGAFAQAERHLQDAVRRGATEPAVRQRLALVRLVRSLNPLSPGLVSATRVTRVRGGLTWAAERLRGCAPPDDDPLLSELVRMSREPLAVLRESDALVEGIALIGRAVDAMTSRCAERDPAEAAWQAIDTAAGVPAG